LAKLTATEGFIIAGKNGSASLGNSVSGAGDVNKDGFDDVIVGSSGEAAGNSTEGASYIIYGRDFTGSASVASAADVAATERVLDARDLLEFSGADALSAVGESDGSESRTVSATRAGGAVIHQARAAGMELPADADVASAV
jgi:hypothetical protein